MNGTNKRSSTAGNSFSPRKRAAVLDVIPNGIHLGGAHRGCNAGWHIDKARQTAILCDTDIHGWRPGFKALHGRAILGIVVFFPESGLACGQIFARHAQTYRFHQPALSLEGSKAALRTTLEGAAFNPVWVCGFDDAYTARNPISDMSPNPSSLIPEYLLGWLDRLGFGIIDLQSGMTRPIAHQTTQYEHLKLRIFNALGVRSMFGTQHPVALKRFDDLVSAGIGLLAVARGACPAPELPFDSIPYWNALRVAGQFNPP